MIIGPKHWQSEFSISSMTKLVAEASNFNGVPLTGRLYDDACDEGFVIVSPTGREVAFVHDRDQRDAEGELQVSIYKSVEMIRGRFIEVHILND
jgi:hypothetical protein